MASLFSNRASAATSDHAQKGLTDSVVSLVSDSLCILYNCHSFNYLKTYLLLLRTRIGSVVALALSKSQQQNIVTAPPR
jgi:hypothetical protein